jgi:hypothetical protein
VCDGSSSFALASYELPQAALLRGIPIIPSLLTISGTTEDSI